MWLMLCDIHDISALWLYRGLKKLNEDDIELISLQTLIHSLQWQHTLSNDNKTYIAFELADGRHFNSRTISGVLNRLSGIPPNIFPHAAQSERQYAIQEFNAFFTSWLHSIPVPVINRPSALNLNGGWYHASEWAVMASRAGLPTLPYHQSSGKLPSEYFISGRLLPYQVPTSTVFVVGDIVIGDHMPEDLKHCCLMLAQLANVDLLSIEFLVSDIQSWQFAGVTAQPDLRTGGLPLIRALHERIHQSTSGVL